MGIGGRERGLLFGSRSECYRQVLYVLKSGDKLKKMRRKARETVGAGPFRFASEKEGYLAIYGKLSRAAP